jgi:protein YIPF5/7
MDDSDLYGSVFYIFLFGFFNALSGKSLFSYIYGISAFGGSGLHWIFALMSPVADPSEQDQMSQAQRDHQAHQGGHFSATLTIFRSLSVLGYCFLPLTFISALGVAIPMDSLMGYALTAAAVGWATYSASGIFVSVGRMVGMRGLVAYPLALFYLGFGIMVIFSSKGSSVLQVKIM